MSRFYDSNLRTNCLDNMRIGDGNECACGVHADAQTNRQVLWTILLRGLGFQWPQPATGLWYPYAGITVRHTARCDCFLLYSYLPKIGPELITQKQEKARWRV